MQEQQAEPAKGRLRGVVDRVPTSWFGWLIAALVLAVTAGFGGLEPVAADDVRTLGVGEAYEGTPLTITVTGVTLAAKDASLFGRPDQQALLVRTEVTNTWTRPLRADLSILNSALPAILWDGRRADQVRHADGTIGPAVQPGVPTALTWIWLADPSQVGDTADLELQDQTIREVGLVDQQEGVADPALAARVRATVGR